MSNDWAKDINEMHAHFGVHRWIFEQLESGDDEKLVKLLEFRLNFLSEEMLELRKAVASENKEEVVDALIDLCVVAIGTLDLFRVDAQKAWDEILKANIAKQPGVKPGRPNPLGLPDLMKPAGWKPPSHEGNTGCLPLSK